MTERTRDRCQSVAPLDRARECFALMLDTVREMLSLAFGLLSGQDGHAGAQNTVYEMDHTVDAAQKQLRRDLVSHLAANPQGEAVECLALMVAAKDAERIGDYCKNLVELTDLAHGSLVADRYGPVLQEMFSDVMRLFELMREGLAEQHGRLVIATGARAAGIEARCSAMIQTLVNDVDLSENHAVCLALAFRGCKRISAHLANIVSALAGSFWVADDTDEESTPGHNLAATETTI